jgi:hypothetical protein
MALVEGYKDTGTTTTSGGSAPAWNPDTLTAKAQLDAGQTTQLLAATNFGFGDMPDDATINGIEVRITKQDEDNTGKISDWIVKLMVSGSPTGNNMAAIGTWPGSPTTVTYGGPTNTWGASGLTGATVKSSNFGVQIGAQAALPGSVQDIDINISKIEMRIYYLAKKADPKAEKAPPCDSGCACDCGCTSELPVRYANGEVELEVTDIATSGFGLPWGQRRTFSNQLSHHADVGQGFGWLMSAWPYLVQKTGGAIVFVEDNNNAVWFDSSMGSYTARHGAKHTLTANTGAQEFTLTKPTGEVFKLRDFAVSSAKGMFKSATSPGGQTISVVSYDTNDHITEVQRSYTSGGSTTVESFKYDYLTSGDNSSRLEFATLRRQVDGGAWANYRRAKYAYYDTGESYGHQGDLKTATVQKWTGSAWADLEVYYYRYYKDGESNGSRHLLKYVVNPESYERLKAAVSDPLTATNAQVASYADFYFEYDSSSRVTKETVEAGTKTYTFTFTTSAHANAYGNWKTKTVETLPDGSQNIVYTNYIGQALISEFKSGTNRWIEHRQYDTAGRQTLHVTHFGVTGYDDTQANLAVTLKASDGRFHVTTYYTTTGSGAAAGYVQHEKIKKGSSGTEIKLRTLEYTSQTAGGVTIYPVSKETVYRNDDGTGAINTTFSYTFHSGTVRVQKRTTTLPAISTSQNGSGTSNTREEVFDVYGNLLWSKDERGAITRHFVDVVKGAETQRIDDVDTAQTPDEPAGWTTVSGFGLHVTSDFETDELGRQTQSLGPQHMVDIAGTSTSVRRASWTVFKDEDHEIWSAQGYASGAGFNTYTLVNPVSIAKLDRAGRTVHQISATRASTSGKLSASDTFAQSSWVRWSKNTYTDSGDLTASRVYHTIPSSGEGTSGTNYDETTYGYDAMCRQNKVKTPGGTITRTVFKVVGGESFADKVYIGTNDTGATDSDPTGGGASGNNMVLVTEHEYDSGAAGANGNLTKTTQHVDGSTTRITNFGYDWRDRQTSVDGEVDFYQENTYDNLGNVTRFDRKNTTSSGNLIARREASFDDVGRVYQTKRFAVNVSTGAVGNALTGNSWYDEVGNVIKQKPPGSETLAKLQYDGLTRETKRSVGYDTAETAYADAKNVIGDTIFLQVETNYDAASNVIQVTTRRRLHTATGTGELTAPDGTQPKARVSYVAMYPDPIGRQQAMANYGTNGGAAFTRPSIIPSRSDTVLVDSVEYNSRREAFKSIDPKGQENRSEWNHAAQLTKSIANYVDGDPNTGTADQDVTVELTYNADGNVLTRTTKNPTTGDQTTTYVYRVTTASGSDFAHNGLLRAVIYPDSDDTASPLGNGADSIYDRVELKYNRQGEVKERKDQNATEHVFDFDKLGRPTHDRVPSLGSGIDAAVLRLSWTYEVRGLLAKATSYDNATVGSGNVVNEVQFAYNDFGELENEYQSHSGAVNTGTTPKVNYAYADGSSNHIRRTKITYPNGRLLHLGYNTGDDANLGRVSFLSDDSGGSPGPHLAEYTYLGLATVAKVDYTEPDLRYDVAHGSGNDPYDGLDRFGRVVDLLWRDYGASTDAERVKHGYDRASDRLWRECPVPAAQMPAVHMDELYTYDGIYQLRTFKRGALNATKDAIVGGTLTFAQEWTFDPMGNWTNFKEDAAGDGTFELDQNRTHNKYNEITQIAGSSSHVAHDRAGNTTTMPKPTDWNAHFDNVYDAWNRLVTVKDAANKVIDNANDALNRRTLKKVYTAGVLSCMRHYYFSAEWQILEERKDAATLADRQFVWGLRYIDDLILRDRDADGLPTTGNLGITDSGLEERLYCLQDPNWNATGHR